MRQLRIWLGTAVSLGFVLLLLWSVDRAELLVALREVDVLWLLPAAGVFALSIWVRVLRWRTILVRVLPVPTKAVAELLVIGLAANNILPIRTGEVVRAVLLQRRHGGSMLTTLGTIVVERVFDGLTLALMLAVTLSFVGGNAVLRGLAAVAGSAFGLVALVLLLLAIRPHLARTVIAAVLSVPPARIADRLNAVAARFLDGLTLLGGPGTWAVVATASVATWTLEAATYWIVGVAFGLDLAPWVYLAVCGAANLTIAAPSTSGGIGPYEFFARETVVYFGVSAAAGTAYAIGLHAFVLLPVTLIGGALLWRHELSLGELVKVGQ